MSLNKFKKLKNKQLYYYNKVIMELIVKTSEIQNVPLHARHRITKIIVDTKINLDALIDYNEVEINYAFNDTVDLSRLKKLKKLTYNLDKKVILPKNLEYVKFYDWFNQEVKLPNKLQYLEFGFCFDKKVELPNSLKKVRFFFINNKIKLPENLEHLEFITCTKHLVLPKSLKTLKFFRSCKGINLPEKLKHLEFISYDYPLVLPNTVRLLRLAREYSLPIEKPKYCKVEVI